MKLTNWKMDYEGYRGLDCTSPCDMYSVLLQHGLISDPYYGTNEEALMLTVTPLPLGLFSFL